MVRAESGERRGLRKGGRRRLEGGGQALFFVVAPGTSANRSAAFGRIANRTRLGLNLPGMKSCSGLRKFWRPFEDNRQGVSLTARMRPGGRGSRRHWR